MSPFRRIAFAALALALTASPALATKNLIPAFARKYGVSCQLCHAPVPKLTPAGEKFAANGLRIVLATRVYGYFGSERNVPAEKEVAADRQMFVTEEQLPFPIVIEGQAPLVPTKAPTVGEHTDAVLADVLGLDAGAIAALREQGALG